MKYTSQEVNQMSYSQWMETIAQELNNAGFKAKGINSSTGKWEKNFAPYEVGDDPKYFFLGQIEDVDALEYLKTIGLVNNGRCPMCGNTTSGNPGRFTSGYNPDFHFQICQSCAGRGRQSSANPANRGGCLIALFLIPWHMLRELFISIYNAI